MRHSGKLQGYEACDVVSLLGGKFKDLQGLRKMNGRFAAHVLDGPVAEQHRKSVWLYRRPREPYRNSNARLQWIAIRGFQSDNRLCDRKGCAHGPFCVVLMRLRPSKVAKDAIAHIFGDKSIELADSRGDALLIS